MLRFNKATRLKAARNRLESAGMGTDKKGKVKEGYVRLKRGIFWYFYGCAIPRVRAILAWSIRPGFVGGHWYIKRFVFRRKSFTLLITDNRS